MKNFIRKNKALLIPLFTIFGICLDQATKWLISQYPNKYFDIITGILSFRFEKNSGIAFGISMPFIMLIILSIIAFATITVYMLLNLNFKKWSTIILFSLFLAGAIGNMIDRMRFGYVVDFISIGIFPIFNVADAYLTVSIFLIILFYARIKRQI